MINKVPQIAVCLAAYNGMRWLREQIESILRQVDSDVTLFVSVDLSSDGTIDYVRSLASVNPKVILLPYGMRFGGAAKNFFRLMADVDFSKFQFVAFADQDDEWFDEKLKRAVGILQRRRADGYSSNVTAFWEGGRKVRTNKAQPQREWDFLFESPGPGCTFVMRTELVRRVKECMAMNRDEVAEVGLHDWFVYAFARANGFKWVIDDYSSLLYRQHTGNQIGVNFGWRAYLFRSKKVLNGWGLSQSHLIARLVGVAESPFVAKWARMGWREMVWLAFHARKCRRETKDQFLFAASCLALAILGGIRR